MKLNAKRLLSFVLMLCLFAALLSVGVFATDTADAITVPEIQCEQGAALDYPIPVEGNEKATSVELADGSLPENVIFVLLDGKVKLTGTPNSVGVYSFTFNIKSEEHPDGVKYKLTLRVVEATAAPTPTPSPTPTPAPTATPAPTPVPAPVITKPPYGESKVEGDTVYFVAHADYADTVEWRILSADERTEYAAKDVGRYFAGCSAEGYDEDTLILTNIRYEMDGWKVRAKFVGDGGSAFTDTATLTVDRGGLMRPSITKDPFVTADSDTLSVTANDPNGGTLHYQWYSSADNSNANTDRSDVAIAGATSATFVPPETPGTVYYYCTVWSTLDGQTSAIASSRVAAVTHAVPATPEPTATPAPTTAPEETQVTADPASHAGTSRRGSGGSQFLLYLMGFLILALIAAAIALVIISRREKELDDEEEAAELKKSARSRRAEEPEKARLEAEKMSAAIHAEAIRRTFHPDEEKAAKSPVRGKSEPVKAEIDEDQIELPLDEAAAAEAAEGAGEFILDGWYCAKCGTFNRGRRCKACGHDKPEDAIPYVCDSCGWENPDPEHPPRFCPDCGAPFAASDK